MKNQPNLKSWLDQFEKGGIVGVERINDAGQLEVLRARFSRTANPEKSPVVEMYGFGLDLDYPLTICKQLMVGGDGTVSQDSSVSRGPMTITYWSDAREAQYRRGLIEALAYRDANKTYPFAAKPPRLAKDLERMDTGWLQYQLYGAYAHTVWDFEQGRRDVDYTEQPNPAK